MIRLTSAKTGEKVYMADKKAASFFGVNEDATLMFLPIQSIGAVPAKHRISIETVPDFTAKRKRKRIGGTLIVRMGGIGDLAILSSSLAKMKAEYPGTLLSVATLPEYLSLVKGMKGVDRVFTVTEIEGYSFDKVIDLRYAVEPHNIGPGSLSWRDYVSKDRSDNFDRLCGVNSKRKMFNVPVETGMYEKAWKMLKGHEKPYTVLVGGAKSIFRTIPPPYVEPLAKKLLSELGGTVVLIGQTEYWNRNLPSLKMKGLLNKLNQTPHYSEVIAICSLSDLIISPDTGPVHIAGALKKKCIALFGNIKPDTRVRYYRTVKALYPEGELGCIPCHDVFGSCDLGADRDLSENPGTDCMRLLTPKRIVEAVKEL